MVRRLVFHTYEPLLEQLKASGKFSKRVSIKSRGARQMLDFIYRELISGIEEKHFPRIGALFSVEVHSQSCIIISVARHYNAWLLKSFSATYADFQELQNALDELSKSYNFAVEHLANDHLSHFTILYREASE